MKDMVAVVSRGCREARWTCRESFWDRQSQCRGGFGGAIGTSSADGVGGEGCHPSGMYSFSSTREVAGRR